MTEINVPEGSVAAFADKVKEIEDVVEESNEV